MDKNTMKKLQHYKFSVWKEDVKKDDEEKLNRDRKENQDLETVRRMVK